MENVPTQPSHHHTGHHHEALIATLLECAQACEHCMSACLEEEDVKTMAHCIELDRHCAEICFLGAKLLIRSSEISHKFLLICEEACRECAEVCGQMEHDHCKACAEACRQCAEACHQHHGSVSLS